MKIKLLLVFMGISALSNAQVFVEKDGVVSVEAEHFASQTKDEGRKWYLISDGPPNTMLEADEVHSSSASGNKYLKVLPDTRKTHDDKMVVGENFTNVPGEIAVLGYEIEFTQTGKYYVWARAYSTGSEDNGIHVGLNGKWPESGQRMQWCEGKNNWTWASKQRTADVHCGVEKLIFLEIDKPGKHTVSFSMREDGFEFDKFILSKIYQSPEGTGPDESPHTN